MTPKEKKELKESLIKQLLHEGDSEKEINFFKSLSIKHLQELVNNKSNPEF